MGEVLNKVKEAAEGAALRVGLMEKVRADGTPIKSRKPAPAKKLKTIRKIRRKASRKPKEKKSAAKLSFRPLRLSPRVPRISPRIPRLR